MAYDEELADRIRFTIGMDAEVVEKKMFGGLAFLAGGHMAVAASGQGGLLVRVDPDETATLVTEPGVERMQMGGRSMDGWLRVEPSLVDDDADATNNAATATSVGRRAAANNPRGWMDSSSKCPRRIAKPAGFGALAMTVRPPPVTDPATSAYLNSSLSPSTSDPR